MKVLRNVSSGKKRARSFFSRTIRKHMRDPTKFSEERRWTAEESDQVDLMLTLWRRDPMLSNDEVVTELMQFDENVSKDFLMKVLNKL